MTRPRTDWIWLVIASAPVFLFRVGRDAGRTFHPAAITIGYQLDQVNMVITNAGDVPIVLAHVFATVDTVDHTARVLDQHFQASTGTDRTDHLPAAQRKPFQRLLGTICIGPWTTVGAGRLHFRRTRAEWIALALIVVREGLEGL